MTTLSQIREATNTALGANIRLKSRARNIVYARIIYAAIARKRVSNSLYEIGQEVNKDHSLIVHYLKVFPDLKKYRDFNEMYCKVIRELNKSHTSSQDKVTCNNISVDRISFFPTFPTS